MKIKHCIIALVTPIFIGGCVADLFPSFDNEIGNYTLIADTLPQGIILKVPSSGRYYVHVQHDQKEATIVKLDKVNVDGVVTTEIKEIFTFQACDTPSRQDVVKLLSKAYGKIKTCQLSGIHEVLLENEQGQVRLVRFRDFPPVRQYKVQTYDVESDTALWRPSSV